MKKTTFRRIANRGMFEMDKFNEWFDSKYPNFSANQDNEFCKTAKDFAYMAFQEQQAKVEELEGKLKQAYEDVDTFAEAHERECGFKAQLAKDRAELQKRVDACQKLLNELKDAKAELVECDLYDKGVRCALYSVIQDLEQALKGEG
ncbi:hypothetical protein NRA03_00105 [Acinetobacter baumannii]|nr:hypothetical protein [Acinetobacter baumannii]